MIPTPTVNGNYNRKGLSKTSGDGLATFVKKQMWRTPVASQGRQDGTMTKFASKPSSKTGRQDRQIKLSDQVGGKLNPEWVELLMNFPVGWTAITDGRETGNKESLAPLTAVNTDCAASRDSATLKSPSVPQPHGESCTSEFMEARKEERHD
jgi:hypothetical protein